MAATVLNPGNIAIVGYITNGNPDSFSFISLVPLNAGTDIYFTDSGWISNEFRDTEGIIKFSANSDIAAGTVINSTDELNDFTWENVSGSFNLSGAGDQIAAVQSNNLNSPLSSDFTAIYQIDNTGAFEDTNTSSSGNVITGLSEADNTAVLLNNTSTYAAFKLDTIPEGTQADWLVAIKNPQNWTFGTGASLPSGSIEVIPEIANAAPVISLISDILTYTENESAILLDTTATVSDFDSIDFDKGKLTVRFTEGGSADDRLSIRSVENGSIQINASNNRILFNTSFVGTYTGGEGDIPLEITFTSKASLEAVETITKNITYENISDNPSTTNRKVEFVLTDGDGGMSQAVNKTIEVTAVDDAAIIGNNVLLYDGGTGKSPQEADSATNAPWFDYQDSTALLGGTATETLQKDGVVLKTDDTAYAGYTNYKATIDNSEILSTRIIKTELNPRTNFPTLDRNSGYVVSFTNQIISENHDTLTADKNGDGLADRAGFSVIAISEDKKGIELGFWENRIWAQEDGTEEPTVSNSEGTLFTQGEEGVDFDTTKIVKYDLAVKGANYTLFADGNAILEGELRDYTAFEPATYQVEVLSVTPADPYDKSSFLFFGDSTPSAQAEIKLSDISVTTNSDKPSFFKVDENAVRRTFVGKVIAWDPDSTTLSNWEIVDGNLDVDGDGKDAFAINSKTGNIIVNDADDLDFEKNPSFQLKVSVSDGINSSNPGIVTINLNDVAGSQIDGTSENERLKGSPEDDIIDGKAGNDYLYGKAGDDSLTGGSGNDNLYGGEGNDNINGGEGIDTLREKADTDFTLTINTLSSAATGTDTFENIQRVALSGGDSNNNINANAFTQTTYLYGKAGDDSLTGGSGNDNLYGGQGNDSINGGEGIDTLREKADTDFTLTINTLSSAATGTDTFENIQRVALSGGDSNNNINANAFTQTTYLYGKAGDDSLIGGSGNDNLYGGQGNDSINGGEGIDTLREKADTDFTLTINTLSSAATGTDTFENIQRVTLSGGDSNNNINANAFTQTTYLYGKAGDDSLIGGSGNDNLYGGQGNDSINGGEGIDTLREKADTDFTLTINTLSSAATGTDTFENIQRVALSGGDSNNNINANAFTQTTYLYGKAGDDSLIGGSGNDLIKGGEGDDIINGGLGNDRLYGEDGNDIFVLSSITGKDTIYDFEDGFDKLGLSDGLTFENLIIKASGNNTNILQDNQTLAILIGVNSTSIDLNDFISLNS